MYMLSKICPKVKKHVITSKVRNEVKKCGKYARASNICHTILRSYLNIKYNP